MVELVLFVLMGIGAVAGALAVIFARNPVHAALGLLGTLFSLGVLYVVNLAHLVAAVQIIVYAGAVMTLFLFVIMMIGVDRAEDLSEPLPFQRPLVMGLGVIILALAGVLAIGGRFDWVPAASGSPAIPNGTIEAISEILFTEWILPFEVTALLLTIAAAGAIALAYYRRGTLPEGEEATR
jgi:NADH-quinone oxidoreductase subunit J